MIKFIIMSSFLLLFLLLLLIIMTSSFYCWNILTHLFRYWNYFQQLQIFCSGNNWRLFAIRQCYFVWFWMIFRQVYDSIEWFMVSAPPLSRTAVCSSLSLSLTHWPHTSHNQSFAAVFQQQITCFTADEREKERLSEECKSTGESDSLSLSLHLFMIIWLNHIFIIIIE